MTGKPTRFGCSLLLIIGFMLLGACKQNALPPTLIWSVYDQDISQQTELVFTLKQRAGLPLLIKAWGYEVEFELTTSEPESQQTHTTRIPYIRLGPQFQLLQKREIDTEIQVKLTAINFTKKAHISVEAYALSEANHPERQQVEAYRLITAALESTQSENKGLWQEKVAQLQAAGEILGALGQDETRMWIESYEYLFSNFPLYQYDEAILKSKKLEKEAQQRGFINIQLLALQIQAYALVERNSKDTEDTARKKLLNAQLILDSALRIAEQQELEYEQAWIINNQGIGHIYAGDYSKALERFRQAELAAKSLSDNFLVSAAQTNIEFVYVNLGDLEAALEKLTRIADSISYRADPIGLSLLRYEIAKIHARLYEFPEAINGYILARESFGEAEDRESSGRVLISLASAYLEMGKFSRASALLEQALQDLESANYGRGLFDIHDLQAGIYRHLGRFEEMNENRSRQMDYLVNNYERTLLMFEGAKDWYAQNRFSDAKKRFNKSYKAALGTGRKNLQVISALYLCLIEYQLEKHKSLCLEDSQSPLLADILSIGDIRVKIEGMFLWAQLQLKAKRLDEAFAVLDELVNDIGFYRQSLPGVLGAWFWQNNKDVFEAYLKVAADRHIDLTEGAFESLQAIQKIKGINSRTSVSKTATQSSNSDIKTARKIRMLIANMKSGKSKLSNVELYHQLDQLILGMSSKPSQPGQEIDNQWLRNVLAKLPESSALFTIYLFDDEVYLWVANGQERVLEKFTPNYDVSSALGRVINNIRSQGNIDIEPELETLGQILLKPVIEHLPENIFFLPLGEFNGFPLEALKVDGQFLIEQHQVINIRSLGSLESISDEGFLKVDPNRFFVASNQFFDDSSVVGLPGTSTELADITKIFSDSAIHFATGRSLTTDVFYGPEIKDADIIHIASHTVLDVNYPELSRIYLNSDSVDEPEDNRTILVPADIRAGQYNADLVVLSSCQTSGLNKFTFDSNLGFVSEFIDSGAGSVIASLWPVSDSESAIFIKTFYSALKQNPVVVDSLTKAKRAYLRTHTSKRVATWASFQLFQ